MIQVLPLGCGLMLGATISEAAICFMEGEPVQGIIATFKTIGWLLVTAGLIALKNS